MKVLFAGDVHGNEAHLRRLFKIASEDGVETIVQCGDFGFWPHANWGRAFIALAGTLSAQIPLYWIDGNHDNHDVLATYLKQYPYARGPLPTPSSTGLLPRVLWVPRGLEFTLGDTLLMGFGGGWSVDWQRRTPGESWWPGELITRKQVDAVPETKVDILVTHDCPESVPLFSYKNEFPESNEQRRLLLEVVRKVHPDRIICAHHHLRTSAQTYEGTPVEVLAHDENWRQSYLILDL